MCKDHAILGSPIYPHLDSVQASDDADHEPFSTQIVAGLWEWRHDKGWTPFDAPLCDELEVAWQSGNSRCKVSVEGTQYDINFTHMWQQNCSTRTTRSIRRSFYKEAPVWYWWDKDGRHMLSVTPMALLEQEYQKLSAGRQHLPHEVMWTTEEDSVFILNALSMRLADEARRQSYPITRTLIKADIPLDADTEFKLTTNHDDVEHPAVPLKIPSDKVQPDGYKKEAPRSAFPTEKEPTDPRRPRAEPSLLISLEGAGVSIQVPEEGATTIHVAAPQQLLQQPHQRKFANQKILCSVCSPGGPCTPTGGSACCCSCRSTCCGSGRYAKVESSCHSRSCCCCCGCCGVSASKGGCPSGGSVAASDCVDCSIRQQKGLSDAVDAAVLNTQVDASVGTDDGTATQQVDSSGAFTISPCYRDHQEAQPQTLLQGSPATLNMQELLLKQQALESQHAQFLDRQAEHLKKQAELEQQQQALHQQQQQLIHQFQVQQNELAREQTELRKHQHRLEKQRGDQQLLGQQSGGMLLLRAWAGQNVGDAASGCEKQQMLLNAEEPETATNEEEAALRDVEPLTRKVSFGPSESAPTTERQLSPLDEERAADDEYTCI